MPERAEPSHDLGTAADGIGSALARSGAARLRRDRRTGGIVAEAVAGVEPAPRALPGFCTITG